MARQISECNETLGRKWGCHIADVQIFHHVQGWNSRSLARPPLTWRKIRAILQLRQESLNSAILPTKNRYFVIGKSNLQKKLHMPKFKLYYTFKLLLYTIIILFSKVRLWNPEIEPEHFRELLSIRIPQAISSLRSWLYAPWQWIISPNKPSFTILRTSISFFP